MKYEDAPDLQERMAEIIRLLDMSHIDINRVKCLRGFGSKSPRTIARCHALGKLMQRAMGVKAWYAIEFLERFDKLSLKEQDKVIIHELMHIPKTFGGGFRHHDFVCEENVDIFHQKFEAAKLGDGELLASEERFFGLDENGKVEEKKLEDLSSEFSKRKENFEKSIKFSKRTLNEQNSVDADSTDLNNSKFSKETSEFKGIKETKHWWQ